MKLSTHTSEFQKIASTAVEAILSLPRMAALATKTPQDAAQGLELAEDGDTIQPAYRPLVAFRMFEDAIQIILAESWGEDMPGRTTKRSKAYYVGVARPLGIDVYEEEELILIKFPEELSVSVRVSQSKYASIVQGAVAKVHAVIVLYASKERADLISKALSADKKKKASRG